MPDKRKLGETAYLKAEVRRLKTALNNYTPSLSALLRRRSFVIYKREPGEDLLVPSKKFVENYYQMLHKYSFRLFLRDVIKHQNFFEAETVTRYADAATTMRYIELLQSMRLISKNKDGYKLRKKIRSFGETLEWFIAEILRRDFFMETIWGVKFRGKKVGGDYDIIAKLDGSLLYMEVKSSPPKQIYNREISAFLKRVADLSPAVAIFLVDTELRMKDKIVPMFEDELRKLFAVPPAVERIEKELFRISERIFIINAKDSIIQNMEIILGWYFRRAYALRG